LGATPGATVKDAAKESEDEPLSGETPPARAQGYEGYQQAQYDQLAALIEAPVTPMVAPAKTIRTLILPYADKASGARLYMPRFVYSVLEQPRFVLGDYLYGKRDDFAGAIARGLMVNSRSSDGRGGAPQNLFDATSSQTPRDRLGGE
ncbi:MAG: TraV family lipoprotein, partial [Pseudomonadota bacterium]